MALWKVSNLQMKFMCNRTEEGDLSLYPTRHTTILLYNQPPLTDILDTNMHEQLLFCCLPFMYAGLPLANVQVINKQA